MAGLRWISTCAALVVLVSAAATARGAPDDFAFGAWSVTIDDLAHPADVAIHDDVIYVAEADANRVSAWTREPVPQRVGTVVADLTAPAGVAVADDGTVVVSDTGAHRIVMVTEPGAAPRVFGARGRDPGQFARPQGVAVSATHVVVADTGNHRVQVFTRDGTFVRVIAPPAGTAHALNRPTDVALAGDEVIVVDSGNDRVQRFDLATGAWRSAFGGYGGFDGLLDEPTGAVAIGTDCMVVDRRNHRLQRFDAAGDMQSTWGVHALQPREGDGALHYPDRVAIAPSGAFAVVCESFEDRVQIIDALPPGTAPPESPPGWVFKGQQVHFGTQIAVDGRLAAIAEPEAHRIHVFEMSRAIPIVIGEFGERGENHGLLSRVSDLALSVERGRLVVADVGTGRLQTFDLEWSREERRGYRRDRVRFVRSIDLAAVTTQYNVDAADPLAWPIEPTAIALGAGDDCFIADARNGCVVRFDLGTYAVRDVWRASVDPRTAPSDLALAPDGARLAVVDPMRGVVDLLEVTTGAVSATIATGGRPTGAVFSPDGSCYVSDRAAHVIRHVEADGTVRDTFAEKGIDHGMVWKPGGLALDERERVLLVDWGNHRAQIFALDGTWLVTFGTGRAYTNDDAGRRKDGE